VFPDYLFNPLYSPSLISLHSCVLQLPPPPKYTLQVWPGQAVFPDYLFNTLPFSI
jgi:hypothetical protein